LFGSKSRGRLAVAALGDEDFERMVIVVGQQLLGVGLLQRAHRLAVFHAAQLVLGRRVHAAVVGRELKRMVAVGLRERDQARAVKVRAVVMYEVRILVRVLAAGVEPDLPLFLVDAIDAANDVLALRDLVLDAAFLRVE
jgi:hypothetical protein